MSLSDNPHASGLFVSHELVPAPVRRYSVLRQRGHSLKSGNGLVLQLAQPIVAPAMGSNDTEQVRLPDSP